MNFELKNMFSGNLQFSANINCDESAPYSVKVGLAVRCAIEYGADLYRADLRGADLYVLQTDIYTCYIQKDIIQIGCEKHSCSKWTKFTDKEIIAMDGKAALDWWNIWKPIILSIANTKH